jgi:twitching motility protein PilT
MIRVDGDMRRINVPPLEHKQVHALIYDIMNDKQRKDYEEFLETDFSFEIPGVARFRVNAFNQNRGAGGVFRTIPSKVLTWRTSAWAGLQGHQSDAARAGAGDRADGLR